MATTDYTFTMSNGVVSIDLSRYVASLTPGYQRRNVKTYIALDGTEYAGWAARKHTLRVAFRPMTGAQIKALYDFFDNRDYIVWYTVTYRDPTNGGNTITKQMRVVNEWETKYLLKSVDGNRYYAGFEMQLREK